jgi:hypothetical protein
MFRSRELNPPTSKGNSAKFKKQLPELDRTSQSNQCQSPSQIKIKIRSRFLMPQAIRPAPPSPSPTPNSDLRPIHTTMDIDDILASVDHGTGSSPESTALDHQQLTRFWVAERAVSEVLPWPAPLMERVMDRVRLQVPYPPKWPPFPHGNCNY